MAPSNTENEDKQGGNSGTNRQRAKTTMGFSSKGDNLQSMLQAAEANKPTYVIKELFTDQMPKSVALQAMEEISILGSLNSPHIVQYIDSFVSDTKVNIIMEFCEFGDLQTLMINK